MLRWRAFITAIIFAWTVGSTVAQEKPRLAVETFDAIWEIIRDTHFDTNFNGVNWNAVRTNFLPRVERARSSDEVREVIQGMLDLLGESHLMIIPGSPSRALMLKEKNEARDPQRSRPPVAPQPAPAGESGTTGIEVRILGGQIVVFRVWPGSAAAAAGVKPGWIIERVDGEAAIDPMLDEKKAARGQREFLLWHYAASLLKGAVGEKCELEVKTERGERRKVEIVRGREIGEPAKLGNLPTMFTRVETKQMRTAAGKKIGHLAFNLWMLPAVAEINRFVDANRNADGIVIDVRGNLGGIGGMVMGVSGHFVNDRVLLGRMKMREGELTFTAIPRRVDLQMRPTNTFQGKLAILVDGISLSSAELFAGGMQEAGRARIFGEKTGGQALPAVSDRLPNGDLLYHPVADFVTGKGRRLEGNGVVPDEDVPLRLEALRAGRDEVLSAALRWMDSAPQPARRGVE